MEQKRIRFNMNVQVLNMYVWQHAYRASRKGQWEQAAADRFRFMLRILKAENMLTKILTEGHRREILEYIKCQTEKNG